MSDDTLFVLLLVNLVVGSYALLGMLKWIGAARGGSPLPLREWRTFVGTETGFDEAMETSLIRVEVSDSDGQSNVHYIPVRIMMKPYAFIANFLVELSQDFRDYPLMGPERRQDAVIKLLSWRKYGEDLVNPPYTSTDSSKLLGDRMPWQNLMPAITFKNKPSEKTLRQWYREIDAFVQELQLYYAHNTPLRINEVHLAKVYRIVQELLAVEMTDVAEHV